MVQKNYILGGYVLKEKIKKEVKKDALALFNKACIVLREDEIANMEIKDVGLGKIRTCGLQIVTYVNENRYCAKEIAVLPEQTCPEHKHPPREEDEKGKKETFRCRYGKVYLYVEGESTERPQVSPPRGDEEYYTASKEVILEPGMQYTLSHNTKHWFQAGQEGAVVSEFSSHSDDASDVFTDPRI